MDYKRMWEELTGLIENEYRDALEAEDRSRNNLIRILANPPVSEPRFENEACYMMGVSEAAACLSNLWNKYRAIEQEERRRDEAKKEEAK